MFLSHFVHLISADLGAKFYEDSLRGTPQFGVKRKRVAKYSDVGLDMSKALGNGARYGHG